MIPFSIAWYQFVDVECQKLMLRCINGIEYNARMRQYLLANNHGHKFIEGYMCRCGIRAREYLADRTPTTAICPFIDYLPKNPVM
jgi:hypothetical protein